MAKLRQGNPLFTVSGLVEITIHGDQQNRDGDFLSAAAQVLHCSQAEVDEAVAFTGEGTHHRLSEAVGLLRRYQTITIEPGDHLHDQLWDDAARFLGRL